MAKYSIFVCSQTTFKILGYCSVIKEIWLWIMNTLFLNSFRIFCYVELSRCHVYAIDNFCKIKLLQGFSDTFRKCTFSIPLLCCSSFACITFSEVITTFLKGKKPKSVKFWKLENPLKLTQKLFVSKSDKKLS